MFRSIIWTPPPDSSPLIARARPRRQGNLHSDADARWQGLTSPETSHFLREPSAADTTPHRRRSLRVLASPRATTDDPRSVLGLGAISSRSCRRQELLVVVVGVLVVAAETPAQARLRSTPPPHSTALATMALVLLTDPPPQKKMCNCSSVPHGHTGQAHRSKKAPSAGVWRQRATQS